MYQEEESEFLDFWTKYAIIISNFVVIIVLLIYNKFFKPPEEEKTERNRILILIDRPGDETRFYYPLISNQKKEYEIIVASSLKDEDKIKINQNEFEKSCNELGIKNFHLFENEINQTLLENFINEKFIKAVICSNTKLLSNLKQSNFTSLVKLYEPKKINFIRKWIFFLDFFLCIIEDFLYVSINPIRLLKMRRIYSENRGLGKAIKILFNRFSYVNTLTRIK